RLPKLSTQLDEADAVIIAVSDIQSAARAEDAAVRAIHAGLRRGTAVAAGSLAAAGHRRDDVCFGVNAADAVVLAIDDEDVAVGVAADALGPGKDGGLGVAFVA